MPPAPLSLGDVSRLPAASDNVAIATRRLEAGTTLTLPHGAHALAHTILEGHRFAVRRIPRNEPLLSWGLPFGTALIDIAPGDYVCNAAMLDALAVRQLPGARFPASPNFADRLEVFELDESTFRPAPAVERDASPLTFAGYRRPGGRGVGTRNYVVVIGTTSRTASFARQLVARLQPLARVHPGIDGIVALAHTEGGGTSEPNNAAEILRALAGFIVHPNVAAVLSVDHGVEPITNARLERFMRDAGYPLAEVPHHFLSLRHGLAAGLAEGERIVRRWLPEANALRRTPEPMSGLRVALQCGGSDAFSGVSGNPLAGAVVHEVIRHGGSGVLTEADEAMGAEGYLLAKVGDLATARAFLGKLAAFRDKMAWHGLTAESNPSAGNRFRGLYNIALKSLGAVHKKDPRTRLDYVIDYAQPLTEPGFYFMNGPGNDLEGIAGQVGAGCNLFLFATGNGSVTNFPFVPTLKITTTTRRHQLLIHEMDVNAGRYLDGELMEALAAETFDLVIETASGRRTKGEHAGHSQVSLWRDWRQTDTSRLAELKAKPAPDGKPIPIGRISEAPSTTTEGGAETRRTGVPQQAAGAGGFQPQGSVNRRLEARATLRVFRIGDHFATERVGLILPTSMCSAQIARLAAERLNAKQVGRANGIDRFVALTHTEGCGFGGETMYQLLQRTYRGYLTHPNIATALLLEHGCEKVPNDLMRRQLESHGLDPRRYGWASVQLDGGIDAALDKIEGWFSCAAAQNPAAPASVESLGALNLALLTAGPVSSSTAAALASLSHEVLGGGGSVLLAESDPLLANSVFRARLLGETSPHATLAYGEPLNRPGLHIVATESGHWSENLTGLAGCGAHVAIGITSEHAQQGHPLIPLIQGVEQLPTNGLSPADVDLVLSGDPAGDERAIADAIASVLGGNHIPVANAQGFVDFQLTRGELGLTT